MQKQYDRAVFASRLFAIAALLAISISLLGVFRVQAAGVVSGRVYQDFNSNGRFDVNPTLPNDGGGTIRVATDVGVAGIRVTAYDTAGTVQGTATSTNDGTYTLTVGGTGPYRLEFDNLPLGYEPGPQGVQNRSSVQFVPDGNSANVDLGIILPGEFCQEPPDLLSPCYLFGDQSVRVNNPALVSFPYTAGSNIPGIGNGWDQPTTHALSITANRIGTTWGVAWARRTRTAYAASFFKRHAGFGPGANGVFDSASATSDDPGAIYLINVDTNAVINVLTVPGANTNAHDTTPPIDWFRDNGNTGWDAVGKTSLGGISISDNDQILYVMNLENRSLYALNATTGAVLAVQPITSAPNCAPSDVRPFAVHYSRGTLYIGVTCTAESTATVDTFTDTNGNGEYDFILNEPFVDVDGNGVYNLGDTRFLNGYVLTADPTTLALGSVVLTIPFGYPRGIANNNGQPPSEWRPWSPIFRQIEIGNDPGVYYPQPWLTDIAVDRGNLVLGIRDRIGDQVGSFTPSDPNSTNNYIGVGVGDTLRACGSLATGFTLEINGRCGGTGTAQQNTGLGPGGAEYYFDDGYGIPGQFVNHDEMTLGGISVVPGYPDAVVTTTNPYPFTDSVELYDGGVRWFDNLTGAFDKGYRLYAGAPPQFVNGQPVLDQFAKSNGLGDLVALCNPAPIEIGNLVWRDDNRNGIQDPNEPPLAGVTVELYSPAGALLATALTDINGNYYFSNDTRGISTGSAIYGISGLTFNTAGFEIRIDGTQPALTGIFLTIPNAGTVDLRDSDGIPVGNIAVHRFDTGSPGQNNHTYDFGYNNLPVPTPTQTLPPGTPQPGTTPPPATPVLTSGPGITKTVDRPFAAPGDTVTWTVTITNPNATALTDVVVDDTLPEALEIVSATATTGTVTVNGQVVTLRVPSLAPGEAVTLTIVTRVRANAAGFAIQNEAVLRNLNSRANAQIALVRGLPATGETPWWRAAALLGIGGLTASALYLVWRRKLAR
jgi:uncharacterized repeat protein (TIGR01451 family)